MEPQVMIFKRNKFKSDEEAFKTATSFLQILLNSGNIALMYINIDNDICIEYNELNITENSAPYWLTPSEVNYIGPFKMEERLYQLEAEADEIREKLSLIKKDGEYDA